ERRFRAREPLSRPHGGAAARPAAAAARRNGLHPADHGPAADRHAQRTARHDAPRRGPDPAAAGPHGARLGNPCPDRRPRPALRRGAGAHRIYRLFARQGPAARRRARDPVRPVRPEAHAMTAQIVLSILMAGVLLYAGNERRRSPVVAWLSIVAAIAGF